MKERPILFNAPMVRAILEGSKTQTRRVVKQELTQLGDGHWYAFDHKGLNYRVNARVTTSAAWGNLLQFCPYGKPGEHLWVRETVIGWETHEGLDGVWYVADSAFRPIEDSQQAADEWLKLRTYRGERGAKVPGIHMPRWASRIDLEITGVRVERLQDISEADAMAEGVSPLMGQKDEIGCWYSADTTKPELHARTARTAYAKLWESINGAGSWDANPWVWCVEFKRVSA